MPPRLQPWLAGSKGDPGLSPCLPPWATPPSTGLLLIQTDVHIAKSPTTGRGEIRGGTGAENERKTFRIKGPNMEKKLLNHPKYPKHEMRTLTNTCFHYIVSRGLAELAGSTAVDGPPRRSPRSLSRWAGQELGEGGSAQLQGGLIGGWTNDPGGRPGEGGEPKSWRGLRVGGRPLGQGGASAGQAGTCGRYLGQGWVETGGWEGEQDEPSDPTRALPEREPCTSSRPGGRGGSGSSGAQRGAPQFSDPACAR